MTRARSVLVTFALALATFAGAPTATAADEKLALGDVAPPPAGAGVDRDALRSAFEGELRMVPGSRLPKRHVRVSVAITGTSDAPVGCTVNAMLHDAKTGTMIAVLQGRARSAAEGGANDELRKTVLRVAVHNVVAQIPEALGGTTTASR